MRSELGEWTRTWAALRALVRRGEPEAIDLDFKQDGYDKNPNHSLELRRDVTAFANAQGGVIVIGIEEDGYDRARELVGVSDPRRQLRNLTELLASGVSPAFNRDQVTVRTVRRRGAGGNGVVVIGVRPAARGSPCAVLNGKAVEFWIRQDRSKREMTYAQIAVAFSPEVEDQLQLHVDAIAITKIQEIEEDLRRAGANWAKVDKALSLLDDFLQFHRNGLGVSEALLDAAILPLDVARAHIPVAVAEKIMRLVQRAMPMDVRMGPFSDREIDIIRWGLSEARGLIYVGVRYLRDIEIVDAGAELLAAGIRFAGHQQLPQVTKYANEIFAEMISYARQGKLRDVVRLLRFRRNDAMSGRDGKLVPIPAGLESIILHGPRSR